MTNMSMGVLLVDKRTLPCRGLRDIIDDYPSMYLIAEARTSYEAIRHCVLQRPSVVLVDAATPTVDGVEVVTDIRSALETPPPILSLVNDHDETARKILEAGAEGLLYMYSSPQELEAAVLMIGLGYSISLSSPLERPRYSWDVGKGEAEGLEALSEREFEVLKLIAQGRTNEDIAELLELQKSTVKSHVQRLLHKVNRKSRAELAVLAYEKCMAQKTYCQSG